MSSPVEEQQAGTAPPAEQALTVGEKETGPEHSEELAAPAIPAPPPVQVPDRYDLLRCTLHFAITMLEDDGDPAGRRVILGVRNDEDDPMTRMVRATGPEALLAILIDLQAQLAADLPRRQEAMRARLEKTQRARQQAPKTAQKGAHPASPPSPPPATQPGEGTSQDTAASTAPKPTAVKRGAKEQEESPFEQMSLFGA